MQGRKVRVALVCGGRSGEHEVSLRSARSIVDAIDPQRFEVSLVGIDQEGRWHRLGASEFHQLTSGGLRPLPADHHGLTLPLAAPAGNAPPLAQISSPLADVDVVFPILHGTFGEDGCMQGLLELADVAYVGAGVLGSAVGMDKDVQKRLLRAAGIPVVDFLVTDAFRLRASRAREIARIRELALPVFVKPANLGSSVGVSKVSDWATLDAALDLALQFDRKLLVERGIDCREIECAVLGNDEPQASVVGEICANDEFYSYEAKYVDENGATLLIPAPLSDAQTAQIQSLAVRVFRELECAGMARVDFFLERGSDSLYVNEINTIPGFTSISMYPKLWQASGLEYRDLIARLIELAIERHAERSGLRRSFALPARG